MKLKKGEKNLFLSENTFLRYFNFSVLYLAQGAPEGITFYAIPAWLAMNNKTPMEIVKITSMYFKGATRFVFAI